VVTLTLVTVGLLTFRWIVNRMPVLNEHVGQTEMHHEQGPGLRVTSRGN
jgi:hypothetical protein